MLNQAHCLHKRETIIYNSIGSAARSLLIHQGSISAYLKGNRTKPFKGKYFFKLI